MAHSFLTWTLLAGASLAFAPPQTGRTSPLAIEFAKGASTYDIASARGLKSFQCDVDLDWSAFLSALQGSPVSADSQGLAYLRQTRLTVNDSLLAGGSLNWSNTANVPKGEFSGSVTIQHAMERLFKGFFFIWNKFATGDLTTLTDDKTSVERTSSGYRLSITQGENLVEETYDRTYLLERFHTHSPDEDFELLPSFSSRLNGRVVTTIATKTKTLTSETEVTRYSLEYERVSSYDLPSVLKVELPETPALTFSFKRCNVTADSQQGEKAKNMRN